MSIVVLKSVSLGENGEGERYELTESSPNDDFVRGRALFLLSHLPPVYPVEPIPLDIVEEINKNTHVFLSETTRKLSSRELITAAEKTFGKDARERFTAFLRTFKKTTTPAANSPNARPYFKLYSDIPHGFWHISRDDHDIVSKYTSKLREWAKKAEENDNVEFDSLGDFAKTYPIFAKRLDRSVADNAEFPPAVLLNSIGAVPYTRSHTVPRGGDDDILNCLRSMQFLSKMMIRMLQAPKNDKRDKERSDAIMSMVAFSVFFIEELRELSRTSDVFVLSRKMFGVSEGFETYFGAEDYPQPRYADEFPSLVTYAFAGLDSWNVGRRRRLLRAEACFLSYCRDFAMGNIFVLHALKSTAFRSRYIENAIGGLMIAEFDEFVKRRTPEYEVRSMFWKHIDISPGELAENVTVAEALSVFTARKKNTSDKNRDEKCAKGLEAITRNIDGIGRIADNVLNGYIGNTLAAFENGDYRPLGWICSSRINFVIAQKWHELEFILADMPRPSDKEIVSSIASRIGKYVAKKSSQSNRVVISHADIYYTLNGASPSRGDECAFGVTAARINTLPLLMLDPTTVYTERLTSVSDEEDRWTMCGSKAVKSKSRVCDLRNHLYLQPGAVTEEDIMRMQLVADAPPLYASRHDYLKQHGRLSVLEEGSAPFANHPGFDPVTGHPAEKKRAMNSVIGTMMAYSAKKKSVSLHEALDRIGKSALSALQNVDVEMLRLLAFASTEDNEKLLGKPAMSTLYDLVMKRHEQAERQIPEKTYDFAATDIDDTYRSMAPFRFISREPLDSPDSGLALLETSRQHVIDLEKDYYAFASGEGYSSKEARVIYAVKDEIISLGKSSIVEQTRLMYAVSEVASSDIIRKTIADFRAFAAKAVARKHATQHTNVTLTLMFDEIIRTNFSQKRDVILTTSIDMDHPYVIGMHRSLYNLLSLIEGETIVNLQMKNSLDIRPHERYQRSLVLSSTIVGVNDRGIIYCRQNPWHEVWLSISNYNTIYPILGQDDVDLFNSGEFDYKATMIMSEHRVVTVRLINSAVATKNIHARIINKVYLKVCLANGFTPLLKKTPEKQETPKKKTKSEATPEKEESTSAVVSFDHSLKNAIYRESVVDSLVEDISLKTKIDMNKARISFCFIAMKPIDGDVIHVDYGVYSAVDLVADDAQQQHVIAIVCGEKVYLTSTGQ